MCAGTVVTMATKRKPRKARARAASDGDCIIPPALSKEELHRLLFRQSENEAQQIRDYVEWQAHGAEKVLHVEKVASERVFGREYDVWDVIQIKNVGGSLRELANACCECDKR
jgi:hypothetical protein